MAETGSELARLKSLLLQPETNRLDQLQAQVATLDERVGTPKNLEESTAEILVEAFRQAEQRQHRELARAVAPVVVAAIQSEIRNSRDIMVDALYPITGRLVAAAVADAFKSLVATINERMDAMMSMRMWQLRFKALVTRRPFSELLLADSARPQLRRLLLLERGSGLLIGSWPERADGDRSEMFGSTLAAITEFAASAFEGRHDELRSLDTGASTLLMRTSPLVIVAGEFSGAPQPRDEESIGQILAGFAAAHGHDGVAAAAQLEALSSDVEAVLSPPPAKAKSNVGIWIVAALLGALLAWWGWSAWTRAQFESGLRAALDDARAARPYLAAYPLTLDIDHAKKQVRLSGILPSPGDAGAMREAVRPRAGNYATGGAIAIVANQEALAAAREQAEREREAQAAQLREAQAGAARERENLAANLREGREQAAQAAEALRTRVEKLAAALEAQSKAAADLAQSQARAAQENAAALAQLRQLLEGQSAASAQDRARLETLMGQMQTHLTEVQSQTAALENLATDPRLAAERFMARNAIFFERDAIPRDPPGVEKILDELARLLLDAKLGVRIVGYSSDSGSLAANRTAALERARAVALMLSRRGIALDRIVLVARPGGLPIDDAPDAPGNPNRRATFEPIYDGERPSP